MNEFELATAADELEPLVLPQLHAKDLHIHGATAAIDELHATADPEKVRQILLNLLSNAIKFTEPTADVTSTATCTAERSSRR